jgi:hypothetical protein
MDKLEYNVALSAFLVQLEKDQNIVATLQTGNPSDIKVWSETGRKYDKIIIAIANNSMVRYFVDRSNGNIYGSKSKNAPNLKWWFGDIFRASKWQWGSYHGIPLDDPEFRAVKHYGPYVSYIKI